MDVSASLSLSLSLSLSFSLFRSLRLDFGNCVRRARQAQTMGQNVDINKEKGKGKERIEFLCPEPPKGFSSYRCRCMFMYRARERRRERERCVVWVITAKRTLISSGDASYSSSGLGFGQLQMIGLVWSGLLWPDGGDDDDGNGDGKVVVEIKKTLANTLTRHCVA